MNLSRAGIPELDDIGLQLRRLRPGPRQIQTEGGITRRQAALGAALRQRLSWREQSAADAGNDE